MSNAWKAVERAIAKALHGERIGVTGRADGNVADVLTTVWAAEVKSRSDMPIKLRQLRGNGNEILTVLVRTDQGERRMYCASLRTLIAAGGTARVPRASYALRAVIELAGPWAKAFIQADKAALNHKRTALVVLHAKGQNYADALCFWPIPRISGVK
jgi:hypothetical protein